MDYLLKPFSAERFERALDRARSRLGERLPSAVAAAARPPNAWAQRIVVKDGARVICLGKNDEKGNFNATRIDLRTP